MKPYLTSSKALKEGRHELWLRAERHRLEEIALPMLDASAPGQCLCDRCEPDCTCPLLGDMLLAALVILDCETSLDSYPRWLRSSAPWGRPLL